MGERAGEVLPHRVVLVAVHPALPLLEVDVGADRCGASLHSRCGRVHRLSVGLGVRGISLDQTHGTASFRATLWCGIEKTDESAHRLDVDCIDGCDDVGYASRYSARVVRERGAGRRCKDRSARERALQRLEDLPKGAWLDQAHWRTEDRHRDAPNGSASTSRCVCFSQMNEDTELPTFHPSPTATPPAVGQITIGNGSGCRARATQKLPRKKQ